MNELNNVVSCIFQSTAALREKIYKIRAAVNAVSVDLCIFPLEKTFSNIFSLPFSWEAPHDSRESHN